MKRAYMKLIGTVALGIGLFTAGAIVQAGVKTEALVTIGAGKAPGSTLASGSVGSARAAVDGTQEIGCKLEAGATTLTLRCNATNATRSVQCFSSAPTLVQAAGAIGQGSHILFSVDSSSNCTSLFVDNNSKWKPMVP